MATIPASENEFPEVLLTEGAAPAAPGANLVKIYAKSDGLLYSKDDANTETALGPGTAAADHIADTTDAHDASAVSFDPTGLSSVTGTEVQTAIEELDAAVAAGGISPTIVDAKGDIIAATAADTVARVAAGANGSYLTAESGQTAGLLWVPGPVGAAYKRTSGDYTTSSATMVDVDGTNLALTITTRARRVRVGLVGTCSHSVNGGQVYFDVSVDGTDQGQTSGPVYGLVANRIVTAGYVMNASFTYLTDVLTAGSHTFKLRWAHASGSGSASLYGGSTNRAYMQFWVEETLLTA